MKKHMIENSYDPLDKIQDSMHQLNQIKNHEIFEKMKPTMINSTNRRTFKNPDKTYEDLDLYKYKKTEKD